jgi:regulator of cell morphogenesis and NO signaling
MNFIDLMQYHEELHELFYQHQRALLRLDFSEAVRSLKQYRAALHAHMLDEEERLFPLYEERAPKVRGETIDVFLGEHQKMKLYLDLYEQEIPTLADEAEPERKLLQVLDSQATFKRLCGHHDTRERKVLYPALDKLTTEEERNQLMRLISVSAAQHRT